MVVTAAIFVSVHAELRAAFNCGRDEEDGRDGPGYVDESRTQCRGVDRTLIAKN
jgi:hypothetical protein